MEYIFHCIMHQWLQNISWLYKNSLAKPDARLSSLFWIKAGEVTRVVSRAFSPAF